MIANAKCQHCGNEFETDGTNRTEFCPHCGKETTVFKPSPSFAPKSAPKIIPEQRMGHCRDCNGVVSTRALFCPHCGAFGEFSFRFIFNVTGAVILALAIFSLIGAVFAFVFEAIANAGR
jgi:Zn finger protein HypA/HybF involved in hydrogenase expression